VVTEATRLETLTGDLLEFARSGPIARRSSSPTDLAVEAAREVAPDGIVVDAGSAPAQWSFDGPRLRHALVNILQNAVQASPDGHPRLSIRSSGDTLIFEVRDFGPGIPAGTENQLFEPFFTTRTNGTGLGLAVARRAAEGHGGTIQARNHPDGGAVFEVRIPEA
jgi:signal transduction histidine kinase